MTQFALGSALGLAVRGREAGAYAALWGGVTATLPDLDIVIPHGDAVANLTYHRSWSHSIFVLAAVTPLVAWLIGRFHAHHPTLRRGWGPLVAAALLTHPVLDCFTVFGTQILWPIPMPPVSWGSVFVIDPIYTGLLLVGIGLGLLWRTRRPDRARRAVRVALLLSTAYLGFATGAQQYVRGVVHDHLQRANLPTDRVLVTAAPLTTLLWLVVVRVEGGYHAGSYSLLAGGDFVPLAFVPSADDQLDDIADSWAVQRLKWFSHGFFATSVEGRHVVMRDLRMGVEPDYVFRIAVGTRTGDTVTPLEPTVEVVRVPDLRRVTWLWERMFSNAPIGP